MNHSVRPLYGKTSQSRGRSHGWAAFDLKQRLKEGCQSEVTDLDPYPPISGNETSLPGGILPRNNVFTSKSFSSVLQPSVDFPVLNEDGRINKLSQGPCCGGNIVIEENNPNSAIKKLKEQHGWADDSLIEDVMVSVDNDVNKASTLLNGMVSGVNSAENVGARCSTIPGCQCDKRYAEHVLFPKSKNLVEVAADIADLRSTLEDALEKNQKGQQSHSSYEPRNSDDAATNMKLILGHLKSVPVEPEWEEDDFYLSHRKDALRMMRLASQHSRAATNAFLRGDHFSAKQRSQKAQEEWLAAESLNSKAAKEILSLRNSGNNLWKLDLHGLHSAEAIQALKEHLLKIETCCLASRPVSSDNVKTKDTDANYSSSEAFNRIDKANLDKEQSTFRQRQTSVQVITGAGNHSRGQAALPTAVRGFLDENGYHFDEVRPGVITVRTKFRAP
ncbi:hypothetical protein K2173_011971 [Erythroxylum novogranatense]|uniref:Smr domain-containing protein n=1 Tax=Erythroxylum novogranatense TaxID=1862640 RepID=A0AAV8TGG4_9ROSI|nr:hypothetical protein K2173_011971 [Erythroxylum novogranatense]